MDTQNSANEMAGMATIRIANNGKRILRILNHLCQIILRVPGCALPAAGCLD
jgi:hypothetical protein